MGKGGNAAPINTLSGKTIEETISVKQYTAKEVAEHAYYKEKKDAWLVYKGDVYNISKFAKVHPGGAELITTYEGQDATTVMDQMHPDIGNLKKYFDKLKIGRCEELQIAADNDPIMVDFNNLTDKLHREGYFESNKLFYAVTYLHIVAMEVFAWYLVAYHNIHKWGTGGWIGYSILALIQGTANAQGGWLQHDTGHKSVFGSNDRLNFWAQQLTMGCLCGASTHWWKDRHSRHHAKTNIFKKDPDIAGKGLVLFDDVQFLHNTDELIIAPLIPFQTLIFIFAAIPSTTTWLFVDSILMHMIRNGHYYDMLFMSTFYLRNVILFYKYVGITGGIIMYLGLRIVQSNIFTWVSQISHVPCEVVLDQPPEEFNWVQMQLNGTVNIADGYFNNWFTGHLNYQIEHHLWPTMPRHHYNKVSPMVRELCEKHNIPYRVLPNIFQGGYDVVQKIHSVSINFRKWRKNKKQQEKLKKQK